MAPLLEPKRLQSCFVCNNYDMRLYTILLYYNWSLHWICLSLNSSAINGSTGTTIKKNGLYSTLVPRSRQIIRSRIKPGAPQSRP